MEQSASQAIDLSSSRPVENCSRAESCEWHSDLNPVPVCRFTERARLFVSCVQVTGEMNRPSARSRWGACLLTFSVFVRAVNRLVQLQFCVPALCPGDVPAARPCWSSPIIPKVFLCVMQCVLIETICADAGKSWDVSHAGGETSFKFGYVPWAVFSVYVARSCGFESYV